MISSLILFNSKQRQQYHSLVAIYDATNTWKHGELIEKRRNIIIAPKSNARCVRVCAINVHSLEPFVCAYYIAFLDLTMDQS